MANPQTWEVAYHDIDSKTGDVLNQGADAWEAAIK